MLIMATRYTEMHAVLQSLEVQMSKAAFSRKLAEAKLHVQIYLSESFAVAVCSAAKTRVLCHLKNQGTVPP